ncbi:MAG: 16S rRNA (guanine(527)-N(7))-methyltransferase RsmG [Candidatus Margulisiibacteriota bacterium]|nr:16S rRNA (guanine(527)-N(7))-methyltransferase RsmG [Candidatus Margulisiibacteriota bacterium]
MFEVYLKELLKWNRKFNLTSITKPDEIKLKHFEDSLSISQVVNLTDQSIIDIGAGAGFPGIPLKITFPQIQLALVEATRKKVEFLRHVVSTLNLKDVEIIWGRAEEIVKDKREQYDISLSRAVAKLNVLSELCLPFVKVGGIFVAYKEEKIEDEIQSAENAIKILGGKIKEMKKVKLPDSEIIRSLIIIEKISPTPEKYPRHPGMAKKRPL